MSYFDLNVDPLDPPIEIHESSSDNETIASIRRKSNTVVDFSRIDLSKPFYQVESGKIIPKHKSLLDHFKIEQKLPQVCKIKLPNKLKHGKSFITNTSENDLGLEYPKEGKTRKKPNVMDKLMAQIDAQLIAQGLPVPKSCSTNYAQLLKSEQYDDDTIILQQKNTEGQLIPSIILNGGKDEIAIIEVNKVEKVTQNVNIEIFNQNNDLNSDIYLSQDSPPNDSSRDTILNLYDSKVENQKNNQHSKFKIMESNDGSFIQYKVYDNFEDFSCEQKQDDHIVTSALQIKRCKQIQNNKKAQNLRNRKHGNQKLFKTYEAFLKCFDKFLKLNHKDKMVFYEYDGIKLNAVSKTVSDAIKFTSPTGDIKKETSDNTELSFNTGHLIEVDGLSTNKILNSGFDFGFKYERRNKPSERSNSSYEILDPHGCELCGKTFRNKKAVREHNIVVHGVFDNKKNERKSIPLNCKICLTSFKHLKNYINHQNRIHNRHTSSSVKKEKNTEGETDFCLIKNTENDFSSSGKEFKCHKCFVSLATYKSMISHYKYQHPKTKKTYPFKCKLCKTGFKRLTNLLGHTYFTHNVKILTGNAFVSDNSNIDLLSLKEINPQKSQVVESKLLIADSTTILTKDCMIVNKASGNILESNDDINVGRMERDPLRYQMNKITVAIDNGDSLDLYKCERCPKVFALQKSLADHKRRVHLKSNLNDPNYNFICKLCKKGYKRSNDLMRHARLYHKVIIRNNRSIRRNISKDFKIFKLPSDQKKSFEKTEVDIGNSFDHSKIYFDSHKDAAEKQLSMIKNAWVCDFCSKSYDTQKKWRDHRRRVHISRPIVLNTFSNQETTPEHTSVQKNVLQDVLNDKLLDKNDRGEVLCHHCEDSFDSSASYRFHLNDKHSQLVVNADSAYPYCCQKCRKVFTKSFDVIKHAKDAHGFILREPHSSSKQREYFCDSCPKQFRFKQSLRRHIESAHSMGINPNEYVKCNDGCSKSFQSQIHLERHLQIYSHFRCLSCNMHFSNQIMLDKHQVYHTKERQYICSVCTKTYMQKHHLVQHELTHGVKKHKCRHCPIACYTGSQLNSHMRTHSVDRPFKCHFCPDSFKRAQALKQHEQLHTGEKSRYCCTSCDRSFRSSNVLTRHERSHRTGKIA